MKKLFLDIHRHVDGLMAEAVTGAHPKDLETQAKYGVKYLKYWFDEGTGKIFCLVEAPNKEAAIAVHREAHGLVGRVRSYASKTNANYQREIYWRFP